MTNRPVHRQSAQIGKGRRACFIAGLLVIVLAKSSLGDSSETGVVVVEITAGSALEKAGLESDDLLLAWERLPNPASSEGAHGELHTPFDWAWVKMEQAPRGTVRLSGEHKGEPRGWKVELGLWEAKVRPAMPATQSKEYLRGQEMVAAGDFEGGAALWKNLADQEEDGPLRCWLYSHLGDAWVERQAWENAHAAYRAALETTCEPVARMAIWGAVGLIFRRQNNFEQAEASFRSALKAYRDTWGEILGFAVHLNKLGNVAIDRGQLDEAMEHYQRALEIREKLAPDSLDVAASLNNLGAISQFQNRLDEAAEHHQRALKIRIKLAPESLDVAASLNNLGSIAFSRGQLDGASNYYQQALEIHEKLALDSIDMADGLSGLGIVAWKRGQLDEAAGYCQRALEIREKLTPESLNVARELNRLGAIVDNQGQLDVAMGHFQRALVIQEQLAPDSLDVARILNNLGSIARQRGQLDVSVERYQRALQIQERLAPKSLLVASSLNNLGRVVAQRGQLDVAKNHIQRALTIKEELAPDSLDVAAGFTNLAFVAWTRKQFDLAENHIQRALKIRERLAPDGLAVASSLNNLGLVAWKLGQFDVAENHIQRALGIKEQLAPNSLGVASSLFNLGAVAKDRGQLDSAEIYFDRSLGILETQIGKLRESHFAQGDFRTGYRSFYRDYIELLLQRNRPEEAFAILERSRARSFLAMLEERELIFSDIPEDLDRQHRSLVVLQDRVLRQLTSLSATKDQEKVETLQGELTSLYRQRDELRATIRQQSPHLANLQEPQPLDFASVQEILDPGTVMLSYSVGKDQTDLFVVTPDQALTVHTLAIGEAELDNEVRSFRELIGGEKPNFQRNLERKAVEKNGKYLYDLLVKPAADVVEYSDRVVLIPDGPLHRLPFAALIRQIDGGSSSTDENWQYISQWKSLHSVLSATVYAELMESRRTTLQSDHYEPLLAAFGDPDYPLESEHDRSQNLDIRVRTALDRCGFEVERLPATRREILGISSLHRNVQTYLGQGAREENIKALGDDARIVHIAAHACLDDRLPLNSGLFLTLPGGPPSNSRDNGLLQAWEIYESVRLDADLVVLSACVSGLGEEQGGEGLIGLTRAFQYAGARTVAASLWGVDDQVTAELMMRFYRHLRDGNTKDAALRAAQIELIRGPIEVPGDDGQMRRIDASAPYYWAAFQVLGDWR